MKQLAILIAILFFLVTPAQAQTPAGSIFAAQCGEVTDAYVHQFVPFTGAAQTQAKWWVHDVTPLSTLWTVSGVWQGYESATPFGGTYPDTARGYWHSVLVTRTPCGTFQTWAWYNDDGNGWVTLFAFYNMGSNCDGNGQHCGNHAFEFYGTPLAEWQRAIGGR